jgi:small subunit ribosomal protein S18
MAEENEYDDIEDVGMDDDGGPSRRGPSRGGARRGGMRGRRFQRRPKVCLFCVEKNMTIDYKQPDVLRRFVSNSAKIRPRRQTGTCARHQRELATAIKRSRHLALLAFVGDVTS